MLLFFKKVKLDLVQILYMFLVLVSVQNPCLELSNLNCSHFCVVDNKQAKCQCEHGFVLANDNQACLGK